jgi:signal transduction histidine kinase
MRKKRKNKSPRARLHQGYGGQAAFAPHAKRLSIICSLVAPFRGFHKPGRRTKNADESNGRGRRALKIGLNRSQSESIGLNRSSKKNFHRKQLMNDGAKLICALLMSLAALQGAWGQDVLREVAAVRSLPRERAARHLPVEMQGVVIFSYATPDSDFFLFDNQEGIYVHLNYALDAKILARNKEQPYLLRPGMLVRLKGVTGVGDYAPDIYPNQIEVVGTGALPTYIPVSMADLQTGSFDSQPVSIRGIIQRVESPGGNFGARILVALKGGGHITCACVRFEPSAATRLLDAMVELHGVACTYFNRRSEAVGVRLQLNDEKDITVLEPALADPFAAPPVSIRNLLIFSPRPPTLHRQCARGTVTFSQPGKYFYIQDGDQAVRITTQQPDPLTVGDVVEVSGFAEMTQYYVEIHEAVFHRLGRASVPAPVPINRENALQFAQPRVGLENLDLEGRLVQISGEVERMDLHGLDGPTLWLTEEDRTFTALLPPDITPKEVAEWRPGSQVVMTGVCVMSLSAAWPALDYPRPVDFRVLTRSTADVVLVQPAPWWTIRRLVIALVGASIVLVLALGLVWILRRTVVQQTQTLASEIRARHDAEVEFKATIQERNRLAADLHDTIEQDLTATAFQLEAARALRHNSPGAATQHTDLAYELLDRSRDELRRSVWALRTGILEGRTFAEALRHLASRIERIYNIPCECSVQDDGSRVPEFEANHFLLFAQEALANALKHASPHHLTVAAILDLQRITITVSDDGSGFDTAKAPGPQQGHFGLMGMKERLNALGGTLVIHSHPGQGTSVEANFRRETTKRI